MTSLMLVPRGTTKRVSCIANRGRRYEVVFDKETQEVLAVFSRYIRWNDTGGVSREIWNRWSGKRMTPLVSCAVRAALAKFGGAE